ncbi:MAG: hypothetical protein OEM39_02520, partial [Acidimicrobiia bacterium]|nr:hypothetical protein [Acidimicrobiia bacterium]
TATDNGVVEETVESVEPVEGSSLRFGPISRTATDSGVVEETVESVSAQRGLEPVQSVTKSVTSDELPSAVSVPDGDGSSAEDDDPTRRDMARDEASSASEAIEPPAGSGPAAEFQVGDAGTIGSVAGAIPAEAQVPDVTHDTHAVEAGAVSFGDGRQGQQIPAGERTQPAQDSDARTLGEAAIGEDQFDGLKELPAVQLPESESELPAVQSAGGEDELPAVQTPEGELELPAVQSAALEADLQGTLAVDPFEEGKLKEDRFSLEGPNEPGFEDVFEGKEDADFEAEGDLVGQELDLDL